MVQKETLNTLAPSPQNGPTHSNDSSPKADECVWPFCGVGI